MEVHGNDSEINSKTPEAGIFTWDIPTNRLYADGAVAEHFGLDPSEAEKGMPLEQYVSRVHPDDKEALSEAIRQAISIAEPYQAHYRVRRDDGNWSEVMAFGRCFYAPSGRPTHFSGIIYPVPTSDESDTSVLWHLLAAHEGARRSGQAGLAGQLLDILMKLGGPDDDLRPVRLHS